MYAHIHCEAPLKKGVSLVLALYANGYAGADNDPRKFWIENDGDLSGEGEVIEIFCDDCEEGVQGFGGANRPSIPAVEEMLANGEIHRVEWRD